MPAPMLPPLTVFRGAGRTPTYPATLALLVLGISFAHLCIGPKPVRAQLQRWTGPLVLPATAYTHHDDAFAAEVNPALLGLMPSWSAAYVHAEIDSDQVLLARGDALHMGTPLAFGLATGFSLHSIRPSSATPKLAGQTAERWLATFSAAFAPTPVWSIGFSARGVSSPHPQLDGLASVDVGTVLRLGPGLETSFALRDLFLSRSGFGLGALGASPAAVLGAQLRPVATSAWVLDGTFAVDRERNVAGRGALGLAIPGLGELALAAQVTWPDAGQEQVALLGEFSANYGSVALGVGGLGGTGFGPDVDGYGMLRVDGRPRLRTSLGVPGPVILDLPLEDSSPRKFMGLAQRLQQARNDPRVTGVLLRPRAGELSLALAQELRLQLSELRAAGKWVGCYLEEASGAAYYACAGAEQVWLDPAGGIRLQGQAMTVLHFGEVLEKIDVDAEFLRIGDYKSAPEQFTRSQMSEAAQRQLAGLLDDAQRRLQTDLARDLGHSRGEIEAWIDSGPQLADVALERGMITGVLDQAELGGPHSGHLWGQQLATSLAEGHPQRIGQGPRVGVVLIDGTIVDGKSVDVPLLGIHASGGTTLVETIDGLAADPSVRAIVVRIDSPGGSVLASDQIWRALYRARQRKPVIASLGSVAASGGYYVASAAHEIWSDPSTLTGSIGIFAGKVDVSRLAARLGVGVQMMARGKSAGADSPFRAFSPDERLALAARLRTYYRLFLARVAEGRGMEVERVDALGRGRVYSGDAAQELGLVDHLGGFAAALQRARNAGRLASDAGLVIRPEGGQGLMGLLMQGAAAETSPTSVLGAALPPALRQAAAVLWTVHAGAEGMPLALLPYTVVLD